MKTAIMQPYFFPYLGYWQLIQSVDQFVILDDVNYIKRGYINKNSILLNGKPHRFSISIEKPSQNRLISETNLSFPAEEREKLLKTFEMAYHKADHFHDAFPVIEQAVLFPEHRLVPFLQNALSVTMDYLGMDTRLLLASKEEKDESKKAQDKIIDLAKRLGTDTYINAIGGMELYDKETFRKNGIDLYFIQMNPHEYRQFGHPFVPNLSMIDIMMFNSKDEIRTLLNDYTLI